jgi:signal peptidase I
MYGLESPFSEGFGFLNDYSEKTPSDFIKEEDIKIEDNKLIISLTGASISRYAPTGSMIPVLDEKSNGIRIVPDSEKDIDIGDIVTFNQKVDEKEYLIVHRVIEKGEDEKGIYFITKGDNNSLNDGKIRFSDIKYVTIGILY